MANYSFLFFVALFVNVALTLLSSEAYKQWKNPSLTNTEAGISSEVKMKHSALLKKYLLVYLLATLSDWLQGPYVYALYSDYGFSQHEIAQLFVAGFGSSMIFGSFVGGMADQFGRRRFVVLFALIYGASCITKHFNHYGILMVGRLLGGIATSLLFSIFEAWLIRSHSDNDLPKQLLSKSFSWAAYSNSIIAITSGIIANYCANSFPMVPVSEPFYIGGFLNPFDVALVALVACGVCAQSFWEENYGEDTAATRSSPSGGATQSKSKWYTGLLNASVTTVKNRDILLCGLISSLFEGSMYIFVFMWTPLLKSFLTNPDTDELPFGYIFSTFMVCCMAGSSAFSLLVGNNVQVEKIAVGVFGLGSLAMGVVATAGSDTIALIGMNIFEVCVGMYFPIMGTMKGSIVPEDQRAAIYNLFRIPLNFIVLFSLLTDLPPKTSYTLNCCMLAAAAILQFMLLKRCLGKKVGDSNGKPDASVTDDDEEEVAAAQDEMQVSLKEAMV